MNYYVFEMATSSSAVTIDGAFGSQGHTKDVWHNQLCQYPIEDKNGAGTEYR